MILKAHLSVVTFPLYTVVTAAHAQNLLVETVKQLSSLSSSSSQQWFCLFVFNLATLSTVNKLIQYLFLCDWLILFMLFSVIIMF